MNHRHTTDTLASGDKMGAKVSKNVKLNNPMGIQGYVTIIKNKGRPDEQVILKDAPNSVTHAWVDRMSEIMYETKNSTTVAGCRWIGLTNDDIAGTSGSDKQALTEFDNETSSVNFDTSEVSGAARSADNRHEAAPQHTDSMFLIELDATFTANQSVTVQGAGLFDKITASGSILAHVRGFTSVTLSDNDTLTVSWDITLGSEDTTP